MSGHFLEELVEQKPLPEAAEPALKRPRRYKVILLNDDYTPMEFVVEILKVFFHFNEHAATEIMLQVHTQGRGICGVFTRDIAETKVVMVNDYARSNEHPLLCCMEPE